MSGQQWVLVAEGVWYQDPSGSGVPAGRVSRPGAGEENMADVTVRCFDELEGYENQFLHAGKGLGVTAWRMNVLKLPPSWPDYPEHDHTEDGQEEVYVVLEGSVLLEAEGETWQLEPGVLARVGPEQKRRLLPGESGVTLLAIGGTPV